MRNKTKFEIPDILSENQDAWLADYLADVSNVTNKTRYRHKEIKQRLKEETGDKCIYCESKIGHNTPGDVEHKKPSSKFPNDIFNWNNLTIACTECNRRKNNYYSDFEEDSFLDPYTHDVESMLIHYGPVIVALAGSTNAEISVKILQLDNGRKELILKKVEKINDIDDKIKRYMGEQNPILKEVLKRTLIDLADHNEEYSAMVKSILESSGVI